MSFLDWSTNAANNSVKPGIDWSEGMLPGQVNGSARQVMADLAAWRDAPTFPLSPLPLTSGGTGAATQTGARSALGLGTMATEPASSYALLSGATFTGGVTTSAAASPGLQIMGGSSGAMAVVIRDGSSSIHSGANYTLRNVANDRYATWQMEPGGESAFWQFSGSWVRGAVIGGAAASFAGTLAAAGAITQAGNQVWHAGNFTPSNYAPLASPVFSGSPAAPTASPGTNTTQVATTAFVAAAAALKADLTGATFTGAIKRDANFYMDIGGSVATITFDSGDTLSFDRSTNKFSFAIGGTTVASIDSGGNLKVAGSITASTTP